MGPPMNADKLEARQTYRNLWQTDLTTAPVSDPLFCCFAFWCGPCASYLLRKRALYDDMSKYMCCGGYMPCSGKCCESKYPEFCLCTEVCCCFGKSVASTRFMIQDEFNIQTTKCDNCIIGFMLCINQLACIFSCLACILGCDELKDIAHVLNCIAEATYCVVCPCMQTQHKVEMDKRDGKLGLPQVMTVPPVQQMSRMDQPAVPSPIGYPAPAYDQTAVPALGYPPPPKYDEEPPQPPSGYGQPSAPPPGYPPQLQPNNYPPQPQANGYPPAYYPPSNAPYPPQK